jgi:hypothetical protein
MSEVIAFSALRVPVGVQHERGKLVSQAMMPNDALVAECKR